MPPVVQCTFRFLVSGLTGLQQLDDDVKAIESLLGAKIMFTQVEAESGGDSLGDLSYAVKAAIINPSPALIED